MDLKALSYFGNLVKLGSNLFGFAAMLLWQKSTEARVLRGDRCYNMQFANINKYS